VSFVQDPSRRDAAASLAASRDNRVSNHIEWFAPGDTSIDFASSHPKLAPCGIAFSLASLVKRMLFKRETQDGKLRSGTYIIASLAFTNLSNERAIASYSSPTCIGLNADLP